MKTVLRNSKCHCIWYSCSLALILSILSAFSLQAFAAEGSEVSGLTEVKCLVAAQAKYVFEDPEVAGFFATKRLRMVASEANTSQMVAAAAAQAKPDCLILSSDAGVTLLKAKGVKFDESAKEYVFKTYPVSIVRGDFADALVQFGLLADRRTENGSSRVVYSDFESLVKAALDGKQWSQLPGFEEFEKRDPLSAAKVKSMRSVKFFTTSPAANSGLLIAIAFGNIRAGTDMLTAESWAKVAPDIKRYFSSLGAKPTDAGKLLSEFLTSRAKPIVMVYESQLIEYAVQLKKLADQGNEGAATTLGNLTKYARLVYFEPTLDCNHPVVPLTAIGLRAIQAMKDPQFRLLAWQGHGFRPFALGGELDVKHLEGIVPGVVSVPLDVISLPEENVQEAVKASLQ